MGKKMRKKNRNRAPSSALAHYRNGGAHGPGVSAAAAGVKTGEKAPRVLFAVGDSEDIYTEGKIWGLVKRLKEQGPWEVVGLCNDKERGKKGEALGIPVLHAGIDPKPVSREDRVNASGEILRETGGLFIPGSNLPLARVLAMDDFSGTLVLYKAQPSIPLDGDLLIIPMMGVDNNTKGTSGLYIWLASKAREGGIPVIGLEVSPLGNKQTLSHLPADHYAVKTRWAKDFLVRQGIAGPDQVSVLKTEDAYCLWASKDEYTEAFLEKESLARQLLDIGPDRFVVFIPHHVTFLWETRKILEALSRVPGPLTVVIRTDAGSKRRQFSEREIVLNVYQKELQALPHVIIDERVGPGLMMQLADLVISTFAGSISEKAYYSHKPTIICQAMGEEGAQGEFVYWEPHPEKIPEIIKGWREKGSLRHSRLTEIVRGVFENHHSAVVVQQSAASDQHSAIGN